ncbi:RHS repeat-associated core domain-containing protein [Streptomyces sp. MH192]|uniref:RHS repeat-associated core domain-containing protein n=1 Tax=Streptomyces sp. MH192 TaxID=1945514 RepID=UPI0035A99E1C
MESGTYALTKRYSSPFGASRGGTKATTWPDDKVFLGKPADESTGLTHVGAREYDPSIGQFLSVDPVLAADQPQSLNGYAYANNSPVTFSDPTGLCLDPGNGRCEPDDGGHRGSQPPDPAYGNVNPPYNGPYDGTRESVGLGTARTDSSGNTSSDGGGWGWGWLKGPLDSIKNYGSAIISQPDIWIGGGETVGSIFLMGFGGDFALGGSLACATGVGCLIGAPVAVTGLGVASIGAAGAGDGIGRISDGLGKAFREAESASSRSGAKSAGGDLGPDWKAASPSKVTGSNGCEECAVEIQSKIGGERMRITDSYGAPSLGKYREEDTNRVHHDVVLREGRVYDAWTGRHGEPVNQYMSRWEYGECLKMSPSPYAP